MKTGQGRAIEAPTDEWVGKKLALPKPPRHTSILPERRESDSSQQACKLPKQIDLMPAERAKLLK
jgi:hypothetical protein